jgi:Ca-activated chloride channel family protein
VGKTEKRFVLEGQKLVKEEGYNFLPRLWATRRIGYLLEEIRFRGASDELINEVKKLGLKYGIVTPYTSFLVTEKEMERLDAAAPEAQTAIKSGQVTGGGAVRVAKATQAMKAEDQAAQVSSQLIQYKEDKTFYLKDNIWVDSAYPEGGTVKEIKFNSDEYYKLIKEKPGIAKYLSVATKLIVTYKGVHYKIIE